MKKSITLTLFLLTVSIASFALTPILGPTSVCAGSAIYLNDSTFTGGIWSTSNPAIATVGSSSGMVTGVSAGTATITYTLSGAYVTSAITVDAAPAAIVGGTSVMCPGATTTLTDATPGGTWYSSNPGVATIGASSGLVTAVTGGYTLIDYSIGTACDAQMWVTVDPTPVPVISGSNTVCVGATDTLTDSAGLIATWSSSNTAIATISPAGVVTGVSAGTVTISLTTSSALCGMSIVGTLTLYVLSTTNAGTITGTSSIALGTSAILADGTASSGPYTWSSSNPIVASIDAVSGTVAGISLGSTTITYSVTGCGGLAYTTATVDVVPLDGISGYVNFGGGYYGSAMVYLISYNPSTSMLAAYDSTIVYFSGGSSAYYQFTGLPTDSFRVKAVPPDTTGVSIGYIPTYHTSHFYWYAADVIYHTAGTSDINEDINILTGTPTTGPGFIAGSVLTGANKGTSGGVPVVGLRMCIVNAATSQLMGAVSTDLSGNYTFSNLPVGQTYLVFPDSLNYLTTPYTSITLSGSLPSLSVANFIQHTVSHTITPIIAAVPKLNSNVPSLVAFPNPTTGKVNIQWYVSANENATVSIADITGREVLRSGIKMSQGAGNTQIDLSDLNNGMYIMNIKSASISYNDKIEIQR